MPGKHPRQRQQPFQLRVADTASLYRIADIFGEVLVLCLYMVCVLIDMIYIYNEFRGFSVI